MFDDDALFVGAWATSVILSVRRCIVGMLGVAGMRVRAVWIGRRFRPQ